MPITKKPAVPLDKDMQLAQDYYNKVMGKKGTIPQSVYDHLQQQWEKPASFSQAKKQLAAVANTAALTPAPVATGAKGPTWKTQMATTAKSFGKSASDDTDDDDPEVGNLMAAIKQELKKKYNPKNYGSYSSNGKKVSSMMNAVEGKMYSVQDKIGYLTAVLKLLNPTVSAFKLGQKVNPGEFHGMPVPNEKLSPFAQQYVPAPDKVAKAEALAQKIKEYEALISKLKAEQNKAASAKEKAIQDKDKLGGMDQKLLQYFSYIEKNCSEYLAAVRAANGNLLFRGQDDASQPLFVAYPRADREPKDSDPEAQKLLDNYLSLCGFKALRSNSIFTSADRDQASNYGDVFAIFPKNGFSFTWSTKHDDLVIHSPSELGLQGEEDDAEEVLYQHEDWLNAMSAFCEDTYDWIYDNAKVLKIDREDDKAIEVLNKSIQKLPEVSALRKAVDHYQGLDAYDDPAKKFYERFDAMLKAYSTLRAKTPYKIFNNKEELRLQKVWQAAKDYLAPKAGAANKSKAKALEVIKKQGFKNDDLPAALKSHHEICVLGEYIAVNYDKYEDEIDQYFITPNKQPKKKKATY